MEFVMWIVVWMVVGVLAVASIPVLVVGTWFVIMTLILGVAEAGMWVLDLGWRRNRSRTHRPTSIPMPTSEGIDLSRLTALIPGDAQRHCRHEKEVFLGSLHLTPLASRHSASFFFHAPA